MINAYFFIIVSTVSQKIWRYHYHAAYHNKNNTQHSKERDRKSAFHATGTLINNEKLKDPRQLADVLNFLTMTGKLNTQQVTESLKPNAIQNVFLHLGYIKTCSSPRVNPRVMCVCACVYARACVSVCMRGGTRVYTHTHTHVHTHTLPENKLFTKTHNIC